MNTMDTTAKTPKELIKSEEFEKALLEGAEYKKSSLTTYKTRNKQNFVRFQEFMYENNTEVKQILDKRKKDRTPDDDKKLKEFKAYVSQMYKQTTDLICEDKTKTNDDESKPKKTKAEKIVERIMPVIEMLRFVFASNQLDEELKKQGVQFSTLRTLDDRLHGFKADPDNKRAILNDIFSEAKKIREKIDTDNLYIETEIFQGKVPCELQYDKQSNNAGLKSGDFKKLVDVKTQLLMAQTDDAKEKVEDQIEHLASEKQFESARAELVRDSLTGMQN